MFLLRSATINDLDDLYELSQLMTFINLPADKHVIEKIIKNSLQSFIHPSDELSKNNYLFVLEDLDQGKVIGTSMIHAQHGTEDEPHFFLRVGQENKFSSTINTGFIHGTLNFDIDTDGPTEIGGLVLNPNYRGNPNKLGKQLSFVRFLYMGLHQNQFKDYIHSELMPPFDSDGKSPLWEAIGRQFLNMEYIDADILSRNNKEFILSLYPSETIYATLLPFEARDALGKVGPETQPVKKMLESIGFRYTNEVDPFDGGPHYRARLIDIKPVKNLFSTQVQLVPVSDLEDLNLQTFLITLPTEEGSFKALQVQALQEEDSLLISDECLNYIEIPNSFTTQATPI